MNRLGSQHRKLLYLGGMVLLLIPITTLGMPAGSTPGSGGVVSNLRKEYDLGESDLGTLDPTGAAMNLALLGFRGMAANVLWMQADRQKNHKDWEGMRNTTEQIVHLQPHFVKIWDFNSWNLAYNVSSEWDAISDRYFWVKEGGKFLMKGVDRNRRSPDLRWYVGRIYGPKIGLSDEAKYFRRFFRQDPDPKFNGGVDPEWNDGNEDHYLVAKRWFQEANDEEAKGKVRQTIQDRSLFRSYPARSQLDYATALQKYGFSEEFDRTVGSQKLGDAEREAAEERIRTQLREQTREAWKLGFDDWTGKYGQEFFDVEFLNHRVKIKMEMTEDEVQAFSKTPQEAVALRAAVDQYQKITNYRYWRTRSLCEAEPETAEAHWQLFAAVEQYRKASLDKAQARAEEAMKLFDSVLQRYPELRTQDDFIEQAVKAVLVWYRVHQLNAEKTPETFPLKDLWDEAQPRLKEFSDRLDRELRQ
uniref:IRE (Iron responsive element) n=1 Tax=Schlesneria paludicola TaxID=360056 RepID=A0A7C2K1Q1_9PLAN